VATAGRVLAPTTMTSACSCSAKARIWSTFAVQRYVLHEDVEPDPARLEAPAL
jgi:hypothetical protein